MYVRLAFAVAINATPDLLIVDEALAVGDARFQYKCMRRIKDIQNAGAAVLFVSHDVSSVRTLCQRAVWLDKGSLRMMGEVSNVTSKYAEFIYLDENGSEASTENAPQQTTTMNSTPDATVVDEPMSMHLDENRPRIGVHRRDWSAMLPCIPQWVSARMCSIGVRVFASKSYSSLRRAWICATLVWLFHKNEKGVDLLVASTQENGAMEIDDVQSQVRINFSFANYLAPGKYLLVAALEDIRSAGASYFEYVEGAHYFSVVSSKKLMGIFRPDVVITLDGARHE